MADKWSERIEGKKKKTAAPLPLKAAGLPQFGGSDRMLTQMYGFSYSLEQNILIHISRAYLRKFQIQGIKFLVFLYNFISAFKSPILS